MRWLIVAACALVAAGCGGHAPPPRPQLDVDAAMSLTNAFTAYARSLPIDVRFDFAAMGLLQGGQKPDVIATAGTRMLRGLYRRGLVEKPRVFAETDIVLAIPAQGRHARVQGPKDLVKPGVRIAMADPATAAGMITRMLIGRMPVAERRAVLANLRPSTDELRDVQRGDADAALVYLPEVEGVRKINFGNTLKPVVSYSVAVVKGTPHRQAARAFVAGLRTRAARAMLRHFLLRPR